MPIVLKQKISGVFKNPITTNSYLVLSDHSKREKIIVLIRGVGKLEI